MLTEAQTKSQQNAVDAMIKVYFKIPTYRSSLSNHTLVEPTLEISIIKRAYDAQFIPLQKDICLCAVFDSGVKARETLENVSGCKDALKALTLEWSENQRSKIKLGSKEMKELRDLHLLEDILQTFNLKHLKVDTSRGMSSTFPQYIFDQFSEKSRRLAKLMVFHEVMLATYADTVLSALSCKTAHLTDSNNDSMIRKFPNMTLKQYITYRLEADRELRTTRWAEMSDDHSANKRLITQVAYDYLSGHSKRADLRSLWSG